MVVQDNSTRGNTTAQVKRLYRPLREDQQKPSRKQDRASSESPSDTEVDSYTRSDAADDDDDDEDETLVLASRDRRHLPSHGSSGRSPAPRLSWSEWAVENRIVLESAAKALGLFVFCFVALVLLLKLLLPPIDAEHQPDVKIPKSFDDLKRLNAVLQIYKDRNYARTMASVVLVYLFLQAYSIPGSMYLSILTGAMYGVVVALPLVCACVATGATMCYLISALLGPALLLVNKAWRDRLDVWRERIRKQGGNMISYMIILRIAPLPPHWVVNIVAPHLNISIPLFWISTFLGVMAVSFIHVQIGTALDQMTSPSEFHLISWRNFFGLAGVVVGVMVPVGLRYYWQQELAEVADAGLLDGEEGVTRTGPIALLPDDGDPLHVVVRKVGKGGRHEHEEGSGPGSTAAPSSSSLLINIADDDEDGVESAEASGLYRQGKHPLKQASGVSAEPSTRGKWYQRRLGLLDVTLLGRRSGS